MRTDWSDKRLGDLKQSVDEVKGGVERVDGRVDGLHRTLVVGFLSLGTVMVGCFGALVTFFGHN